MKLTVEIELDETWDEYFFIPSSEASTVYLNDIKADGLLDDIFASNKQGITNIKLLKISKQ